MHSKKCAVSAYEVSELHNIFKTEKQEEKMLLEIKTTLYHGTICEIKKVDVSAGRDYKDFGRGFYMSEYLRQAEERADRKYNEAEIRHPETRDPAPRRRIYRIELDRDALKTMNIKVFHEADMEWLDFVLMCRNNAGVPHDYDLVIGRTSDSDTASCFKAYNNGFYGEIGSVTVKTRLLTALRPNRLDIQYFIGKQEVADRLIKSVTEL